MAGEKFYGLLKRDYFQKHYRERIMPRRVSALFSDRHEFNVRANVKRATSMNGESTPSRRPRQCTARYEQAKIIN